MSSAAPADAVPAPAPPRALLVGTLAVLGLLAVATVGVLLWSAGGPAELLDDLAGVVFLVWNVWPTAGLAGAALFVHRRLPRGVVAVAVGAAVYTALTAWALISTVTSESSTAALAFVVVPLYQAVLVGLVFGAGAVTHAVRSSRARQGATP